MVQRYSRGASRNLFNCPTAVRRLQRQSTVISLIVHCVGEVGGLLSVRSGVAPDVALSISTGHKSDRERK